MTLPSSVGVPVGPMGLAASCSGILLLGLAVALAACSASPAPGPPLPPAPPEEGPPASPPAPVGAPGAACDRGGECASGVCEGLGCDPEAGVCAPEARACTRDLVPYCGCDGETFRASGNCPGRRYQHRGECDAARADGSPCSVGAQCQSGVCEGEGCGDELGVCMPRARPCTRDLASYCGCDGETFRASGSCPLRRYAHRGPCRTGRADGEACTAGAECASGICEGEGCGDEGGVCMPRDRRCTTDLRPYCGCDGHGFQASGSCPGRRYAHRGACRADR